MKSKILPFVLLIVMACQLPNFAPTNVVLPTASLTATLTEPPTLMAIATQIETLSPTPTFTPMPPPHASRVLILSIDGLRPDAIALAPMPNLLALMQNSAYTLNAQTIYPSVTLPSHTSMLGGICPSKHGVDWNDYLPERGYALGTDLFDITHAAGLQTVMYVGRKNCVRLPNPPAWICSCMSTTVTWFSPKD